MIDISLYDNGSGGGMVAYDGGGAIYTNSLYTAIYIALFGGNRKSKWWGNKTANTNRWVESETENLIYGATITPALIAKVEDAIKTDLKQLSQYGEFTGTVNASGRNRMEILVECKGNGEEYRFIWDATVNEIIREEEI